MKNLKIISTLLVAAAAFVLISCGSKPAAVTEDGWISYTVDNSQKCGCFYTSGELGKYSMIEAEFKKVSGYEDSCFGFVFGYSSQKSGVVADYIRFEINTLGECAVYSYDGSVYQDLIDSTAKNTAYLETNASIKKGYNSVNRLKIEKTDDNSYTLYINGSKLISNIQPLKNGTDGVMAFYSVGKVDQENFPDVPVEISFRVSDFALAEDK